MVGGGASIQNVDRVVRRHIELGLLDTVVTWHALEGAMMCQKLLVEKDNELRRELVAGRQRDRVNERQPAQPCGTGLVFGDSLRVRSYVMCYRRTTLHVTRVDIHVTRVQRVKFEYTGAP